MGILQEKLEFVYDKNSVTNIRHCCTRSVSWDCLLIGTHAWALPGRRLGITCRDFRILTLCFYSCER